MDQLRNVLLTGATGFLGSHLLELLLQNGYRVTILKRATSDVSRLTDIKGTYKQYNVDETLDMDRVFKEHSIEAIIHAATSYGRTTGYAEVLQANVVFPVRILEAGIRNNVKLFVNTDTFFAKECFRYGYLNAYTQSKRIFKSVLQEFSEKVAIASLRMEHVFGERDDNSKFVTNIIRQLISNQVEVQLTKGTQRRDFIYVRDAAAAYLNVLRAFEDHTGLSEYEVGTGNAVSIRELVEKIHHAAVSSSRLNFGAIPMREGEFEESRADLAALKAIGWAPAYTLDEALRKTILFEKNLLNT